MAPPTYKAKLTRPQVFLWRMLVFLVLATLLAIILDGQTGQLRASFMANPGLNALIIGVLLIGTCVGLIGGKTWAGVAAIFLAILAAVENFFFIPYYPLWAIIVIALCVWVIWALTRPGAIGGEWE